MGVRACNGGSVGAVDCRDPESESDNVAAVRAEETDRDEMPLSEKKNG